MAGVIAIITINFFLKLSFIESFIFIATIILLVQGFLASLAMMYSFLKPENMHKVMPPRVLFGGGRHFYSLLVPAKNEDKVIGDTLRSMAKIDYPKHLYEVIVIVRWDDWKTKNEALKTITSLKANNFRLIEIGDLPLNKPATLNAALAYIKGSIVGVFDAEDQPHREILKSVDEVFNTKKTDIVQAGIQLINVASSWFSSLNCLEYYYWFKSILPFLSVNGATPLGGNTVFFRKKVLDKLAGWKEDILTEDADIGVRASALGFKTSMIYLEEMATLEETPMNEAAFIRQRTRWDQGYLQILLKADWLKLATLKQRILSGYLLMQPIIHHFTILCMLSIPLIAMAAKVPVWLAMFSWLPLYFLMLQFGLYFIGLMDLKKYYHLHFSKILYLWLIISFIPYQFLLVIASFRAAYRLAFAINDWEKTSHNNMHRNVVSNPINQ